MSCTQPVELAFTHPRLLLCRVVVEVVDSSCVIIILKPYEKNDIIADLHLRMP